AGNHRFAYWHKKTRARHFHKGIPLSTFAMHSQRQPHHIAKPINTHPILNRIKLHPKATSYRSKPPPHSRSLHSMLEEHPAMPTTTKSLDYKKNPLSCQLSRQQNKPDQPILTIIIKHRKRAEALSIQNIRPQRVAPLQMIDKP